MNTLLSKGITAGAVLLIIFITGFWLSRSGKPYGALLLNAHKLIALGAGVLLAVTVYRFNQAAPLSPVQIAAAALTAVCFAATVLTGGLPVSGLALPAFVPKLHHILPYLSALSSAVTLYLLLAQRVVLSAS